MPTLSTDLRNKLERTVIEARRISEEGARAALETFAVQNHEPYGHMSPEQRKFRNHLRARARQLGDKQDKAGKLDLSHIVHECAYEHWHRMLFARFLAENGLLIEPDEGIAVSLDDCKELAKDAKTDLWTLAGRYAQKMLPQIFRVGDPILQVPLAKEHLLELENLLDCLPTDVFMASDSLGWCYQFWQTKRKEDVNKSGVKIGADELPAVTQLFTEDYMVDFLLDNTLGAWWAGKQLPVISKQSSVAETEDDCRRLVALPGCPWKYLRFIKGKDGKWVPAAGTFDSWPKTAEELKCLDPCMGSGHFIVAMFERLVALRIAEEKLQEKDAVAAVICENLFGLEIDPRCTQIAAFNLALAAWRRVGYCALPEMNLACSGLAPNTKKEDWLKLAGDRESLRRGMEQLYDLFEKAPILGSLINPRTLRSDLLVAGFDELQPLLGKVLASEDDDNLHEMAVTAQGMAKAAEILGGQFTLVATNVPYLARGKQDDVLKDYCGRVHPRAKTDLATCFIERCITFCVPSGSVALVVPQNWLSLPSYKTMRSELLKMLTLNWFARLGPKAFETISGEVVNVALVAVSTVEPVTTSYSGSCDATVENTPPEKDRTLVENPWNKCLQVSLLKQPDSRITLEEQSDLQLLSAYALSPQGIKTGDDAHHRRIFWEFRFASDDWQFYQGTPEKTQYADGMHFLIDWSSKGSDFSRLQGMAAWGKKGIILKLMGDFTESLFYGERFDSNVTAMIPKDIRHLAAIWCFCISPEYASVLKGIEAGIKVNNATATKVPFDLAHWQKVAAEKYPNGLPKPFSSDPTQWLFNGHPKGSDQPLQVAVARLLGYRWPRQTGSSFPDCPALRPDGLEKLEDKDGIVCIPSVRGEPPYDIFVRWKPIAKQPIGWEPDINDGVRLNIRPFLASDIPGGKKGAGILRWKPNIKWDKDRGKEPKRATEDFPWFWGWDETTTDFKGSKEFDGNRWNGCHYTNDFKRTTRDS